MTTLIKIHDAITQAGGEIFVVGGTVRDTLIGIKPKDVDFLVRKLSLEAIAAAVNKIGSAGEVGASFGIVKARIDGEEFDFAIPRTKETQTGDKHTDFAVEVDPFASVESDLSRRDFTINSICVPLANFIEGSMAGMIDPFNGAQDIKDKVLRTVGNPVARFTEDPLRILRGLGFSVRFGFKVNAETTAAIISLAHTLHPSHGRVTGERIFEEFKKAWIKGKDILSFINDLEHSNIGVLLFGEDFFPIDFKPVLSIRWAKLIENEEVTFTPKELADIGFVSFFLRGGDHSHLKPDNHSLELLEVARKLRTTASPHTFIKPEFTGLNTLKWFFVLEDGEAFVKIQKIEKTPISAKQLKVSGEDLIQILGITEKKDFKKIGIAQKQLLEDFWNETQDWSILVNLSKLI